MEGKDGEEDSDCDDDSDHCTLSVLRCGVHTGVAISPARHSL